MVLGLVFSESLKLSMLLKSQIIGMGCGLTWEGMVIEILGSIIGYGYGFGISYFYLFLIYFIRHLIKKKALSDNKIVPPIVEIQIIIILGEGPLHVII